MNFHEDLFLDGNLLELINNNTFTGLSTLFSLSLKRNLIVSLEPNAFSGLSTLLSLYLHENRIEKLDINVFKALKQLKVLSLSYNFISQLDNELFARLKQLSHLELNNNRLKFISFMDVLKDIEFIGIANNQVDAIKKFSQDFMPRFEEMHASENLCINNTITNIQNVNKILKDCFTNYRTPNCKYQKHLHFGYMCEVMDQFDLEDKLPTSVTYDDIKYLKVMNINQSFSFPLLIQKFPKVAKISIIKSNLKHVLEQDYHCNETRIIDIRMNELINLRGDIFKHCSTLQQLILIKNKIPSLPIDLFYGLDHVHLIDMSFNQLRNSDLEKINYNLVKLTKLYLSGNRFTSINENLFLFMNNLKVLRLDSNQITKISENAFSSLKNLKELHLQFNGIVDTLFLKDMVNLTYLNLEENKIQRISSNFPKNLQYIDMSFNQIDTIEQTAVLEMNHLNDLILISNPCSNKHLSDLRLLSSNDINKLLSPGCLLLIPDDKLNVQ